MVISNKYVRKLESLGSLCNLSGVITCVLGILIGITELINDDFLYVQVGILIISIGYALIKISHKLSDEALTKKSLETLSFIAHVCGVIIIFLGVLITFRQFISEDMRYCLVGIFIVATGYSFVKISQKIADLLYAESKTQ